MQKQAKQTSAWQNTRRGDEFKARCHLFVRRAEIFQPACQLHPHATEAKGVQRLTEGGPRGDEALEAVLDLANGCGADSYYKELTVMGLRRPGFHRCEWCRVGRARIVAGGAAATSSGPAPSRFAGTRRGLGRGLDVYLMDGQE